jgi:hypothetical protein
MDPHVEREAEFLRGLADAGENDLPGRQLALRA